MRDKLAIGTMLWGNKTNRDEAHAMIAHALDHGITMFDSAERYPTFPYTKATHGMSETILGDWIRENGRQGIRISTKMRSPGQPCDVRQSVDLSLQRLGMDQIEYYQLHWPNRGTWALRGNWKYDPSTQDIEATLEHIVGMLEVLTELVAEGKLAHIGMSNETAWGITKYNQLADMRGFERLAFVQNEYSLLHRLFDLDLAEVCHHERVKLHAWSPLAGGLLSGKYSSDHTPSGSRRATGHLGPRDNQHAWPAVQSYKDIAKHFNLDLIHMSLAWIATRQFVSTVIVGASDTSQLSHNLGCCDIAISDELIAAIDDAHRRQVTPF